MNHRIVICVMLASHLLGCSQREDPPFAVENVPAPVATQVTKTAQHAVKDAPKPDKCGDDYPATKAKYQDLMEAKQYWNAASWIRECKDRGVIAAEVERLVAEGEIGYWSEIIANPQSSKEQKLNAKKAMVNKYPSDRRSKAFASEVKAIASAEEKAYTKKMKSEGVSIGMSQEAVLASSWGRPLSKNRHTSAYGTTEQWVYGGGNYLHFRNGILSDIQN